MTFWEGEKLKKPDDPGEFDPDLVAPEWEWFWQDNTFTLPFWRRAGVPAVYGRDNQAVSSAIALLDAPTWGVSSPGAELQIDGVNDGVQIIKDIGTDYILDPFTLIIAFRTVDTDAGVVFAGVGNNGTQALAIFQNQSTAGGAGLKFILRDGDGTNSIVKGTTATTHRDGLLHVAVATWDGSTLTAYLDAVELTDSSGSAPSASTNFTRRGIGYLQRNTTGNFAVCQVSLWSELDRWIPSSLAAQISGDPSGPLHMADEAVVFVPVAVGGPKGPLGMPFHGPFGGPI